jgi:hypothetical protein
MKMPAAMAAINASPPITPPTTAPTGVELLEVGRVGVGLGVNGTVIGVTEDFGEVGDGLDENLIGVVLVAGDPWPRGVVNFRPLTSPTYVVETGIVPV